jgi:hypothetical protein
MDGHETAQRLLRQSSPGILLVTREKEEAQRLCDLQSRRTPMEVFVKPSSGFDEDSFAEMARAIRRLAQAADFGRVAIGAPQRASAPTRPNQIAVVGIVCSTGAARPFARFVAGLSRAHRHRATH